MKELRVGIAGLGRLGRVHAANLAHKIPGAVLTAACVPGADSQAYARQELGLEKVYGDFREMVADPELDAVAIVSPSGEHCWQIEAALDAGKHVFSEKPLGVTMEQCLQAEAAVARHPELVCMLGFMRRYDKSYAYAKEKNRRRGHRHAVSGEIHRDRSGSRGGGGHPVQRDLRRDLSGFCHSRHRPDALVPGERGCGGLRYGLHL